MYLNDLKQGQYFRVVEPSPFWIKLFGKGFVGFIHSGYVCTVDGDYKYPIYYFQSSSFLNGMDRASQNPLVEVVDDPRPLNERIARAPKMNYTTGTDPEMFVVRGESGSLIPAFKFLPKQEDAKRQIGDAGVNAYAYRDGFAAECYVASAGCHGHLTDYIRTGLQRIEAAAVRFDRTAKLTSQNVMPIPQITMDSSSDDEVALGCSPSFHAYHDEPIMPGNARELGLRFAGGHVHLGFGSSLRGDKNKAEAVVKGCDLIAGVPCVALFASFDNPVRRIYYGRAGEYRTPEHGLEYRTLSNAWLISPYITHLVLNLVRCGAKVGYANLADKLGLSESHVQGIINNCDVPAARKWTLANLDILDKLLTHDGSRTGSAFVKVIEGGLEAVIKDPNDISGNWKLKGDWLGHSDNDKATWRAISA